MYNWTPAQVETLTVRQLHAYLAGDDDGPGHEGGTDFNRWFEQASAKAALARGEGG